MSRKRFLLVDDHKLVLAGFHSLLNELGHDVVAEATESEEAFRLIALHQPDIVLMDITMPGVNGLEATGQVKQKYPQIQIIILSMHANAEYARRALQAGASGYLLKNATPSELVIAIQAGATRGVYLSPVIARFLTAEFKGPGSGAISNFERLSRRQREILQLLARGYTRKEIAEILMISPKTFDIYRAQLFKELNIQNGAGLIRYATQMGLLSNNGE